ncbi:MAG: transglutaminase family protein [Acetatifactor sp.]
MKKYTTHLLSLALTLTLCFSMYVIYDCFSSGVGKVIGFLTVITAVLLYALCYYTERHRLVGGIIMAVTLFVCYEVYSAISVSAYSLYGQLFNEWLLTRGSEVDGAYYMWALYLFFTTFFSVVIYYFSVVLYRMFFLLLASLVPAVLYLKVMSEMDNVYLVLTVLLNMAIFMSHRTEIGRKGRNLFFGNKLIASVSFILLTFLLTSLVPKNTETPYYDVFEDYFLGGDTSSPIGEDYSRLSEFSGDAGGFFGSGSSNRKLYTITNQGDGNSVIYLKRQNFDYYDFEEDHWYTDSEYADVRISPSEYEEKNRYISLPFLYAALMRAEEYEPGFLVEYGLEGIADLKVRSSRIDVLRITSENFGAFYYIVPTQCLSTEVAGGIRYYATAHGSFYSENSHPADFSYTVSLYNDEDMRDAWLWQGGSSLTGKEERRMLRELDRILSDHGDLLAEVSDAFLEMQRNADSYRNRCEENTKMIPQEIVELADSITDGLEYDYEKALALVEFFENNDFVYDLEYYPRDKSPEFFLFTSKRGSCSDYATAFTLMARAAGLTVRYAEGYVPEEGEKPYTYVIKTRNSHAYPEVYIPNMGWVVFEPTVGRMEAMEKEFSLRNFFTNLKMDYGLIAVIIAFVVIGSLMVTAVKLLLPFLMELTFRLRLLFVGCDRAAILAYNRIVKKSLKSGVSDAASKTPYELACFIQSIGCDMSSLAYMTERVLYGNETLTASDKKEVRARYHAASTILFKYRHRRRPQDKHQKSRLP